MKEIKGKVILYGFGFEQKIVYSRIVDIGTYYESIDLPMDSFERIKAEGIVRMIGILFDDEGNIVTEFENRYDLNGNLIGARDFQYREHLKDNVRYNRMIERLKEIRGDSSGKAEL